MLYIHCHSNPSIPTKAIFILTITSLTVMMTLFTSKFRLEKSLRTFRMTFTSCQLPSFWTSYALISTWTTACVTTQIAFYTRSTITVIAVCGYKQERGRKLIEFFLFISLFGESGWVRWGGGMKKWIFSSILQKKIWIDRIVAFLIPPFYNKICSRNPKFLK